MQSAWLRLADGKLFSGYSPTDLVDEAKGEVVFCTGMTGYVETLTDPSFKGQIVVFTHPLIGNYGVPHSSLWESSKIHASGVIVNESCEKWSHYEAEISFLEWLKSQEISLLCGVDTRHLTVHLRENGSSLGIIVKDHPCCLPFYDPSHENLVAKVSIKERKTYGKGNKKIILVDCGVKENILRSLLEYPLVVEQVPYDFDYTEMLDEYDGVFLSNGPGDPKHCKETVDILSKGMAFRKPIFGICLGSQLMAMAIGAKTYKLHYGHRGQNHPCIHTKTNRCYITSQNHGYAIDEKTLPKDWLVTFRNLNDDSVEGIAHRDSLFCSLQFHPEACPGPTDTQWFFNEFYESL